MQAVRDVLKPGGTRPPAAPEFAPGQLPIPSISPLPRHVAIIMDGNGRWASQRGLTRHAGHRAGTENIRPCVQRFAEHGVQFLTLHAFSTENWTRSKREVDGLLRILSGALTREVKHFHEGNIRLLHIGDLDALSPRLQQQVERAITLTRGNTRMTVAIAFNYGSRAEIVEAVRRIIAEGIAPERVDGDLISRYLYTAALPEPDLIIRTGGDQRLSNFMMWQAAYAELYFTPTFWPDFGPREIDHALRDYADRERRFGGIPGQEPARREPGVQP